MLTASKALLVALGLIASLHLSLGPALSQGRRVPIVRDAETEALMRDYAGPILKAAGLGGSNIEVVLVGDSSFNAFVVDGKRIFINIGVLTQSNTPNQVIGVLAHETGHIAGGHLARARDALAKAQTIAILATILGAGVAAAGAAAGADGAIQGGAGVIQGGSSVAQRSLLSYQRGEEAAADRAAITYLERTGQSGRGMLETFRQFQDQQLFSARFADPYALSHPLAQDRISQLERLVGASKYRDRKDPPQLQERHDLMRAKIVGFTQHPNSVARKYPKSDKSLAARYARAIASYRSKKLKRALRDIDALIKAQPNNPHFRELKGQALIENGKPGRAIEPFRRAVSLAPNEGLLRVALGYALVASDDPSKLNEGITQLEKALTREKNSGLAYRQLAIAYGRQGKVALADLSHARGLFVSGDFKSARRYAARAQRKLKRGTPAWLQADDIVTYKPPKVARRR